MPASFRASLILFIVVWLQFKAFIVFNLLQSLNIPSQSDVIDITKLLKFMDSILLQSANILTNEVTFLVLKLLKSIDIIPELKNIADISVTFDVSNFFKSKEVKLLQSENILLISVTFDVLKLLKFRDCILEQPPNILDIVCTFEVLKECRSIVIMFSQ